DKLKAARSYPDEDADRDRLEEINEELAAIDATQQAAKPAPLPTDEQTILNKFGPDGLKRYQQAKARRLDRLREVEEAHRVYKKTGQIPQTKQPFAWIEIKEGRLMNRAERYDALVKEHGTPYAPVDTKYLTVEEFKDEVEARAKANEKSGWDKFK